MMYLQLSPPSIDVFFIHLFSALRAIFATKVNGTIPPELGNLLLLTNLYDLIILNGQKLIQSYFCNDPS